MQCHINNKIFIFVNHTVTKAELCTIQCGRKEPRVEMLTKLRFYIHLYQVFLIIKSFLSMYKLLYETVISLTLTVVLYLAYMY